MDKMTHLCKMSVSTLGFENCLETVFRGESVEDKPVLVVRHLATNSYQELKWNCDFDFKEGENSF